MPKKTKRKKNNIKYYLSNFGFSLIVILCLGFFVSLIDNLIFNEGNQKEEIDLAKLITKSKYEEKTGHKITLEIHNGCGIPKLANLYTEFLRDEGFDILDSKNANNFDYTQTQILYHQNHKLRALSLSKIMGIDESLVIKKVTPYIIHDLTLIIGSDYNKLDSYQSAIVFETPF